MRTIIGDKVTCRMVVSFDFTKAEADEFLATPSELRSKLVDDFLSYRYPNPDPTDCYNRGAFYEAIGKAMAGWRESELKQLPESTEGGEA